jgi:hypothetical protein
MQYEVLMPLGKNINQKETVTASVYKTENSNLWNDFVAGSKNGSFLFLSKLHGLSF